VRAYWAILSARFRVALQYRAAAVAGFGTQLFWGLIRMMTFEAFYHSTTVAQPMNLSEVVTYVWLGQAFLLMLPFRPDADIRAMIRSGTVAYELVRPLDLYAHWYARAVANRVGLVLLRAVPMAIVAVPFLGMGLPPSVASAAGWVLATMGALLVTCALSTLMSISMLWTVSGQGIARLLPSVAFILSGAIIPLPLFPDWAQFALNWLPFRAIVDVPFRVYIGHIPPAEILPMFAYQATWAIVLILLGRWILSRGVRRLVVQGG